MTSAAGARAALARKQHKSFYGNGVRTAARYAEDGKTPAAQTSKYEKNVRTNGWYQGLGTSDDENEATDDADARAAPTDDYTREYKSAAPPSWNPPTHPPKPPEPPFSCVAWLFPWTSGAPIFLSPSPNDPPELPEGAPPADDSGSAASNTIARVQAARTKYQSRQKSPMSNSPANSVASGSQRSPLGSPPHRPSSVRSQSQAGDPHRGHTDRTNVTAQLLELEVRAAQFEAEAAAAKRRVMEMEAELAQKEHEMVQMQMLKANDSQRAGASSRAGGSGGGASSDYVHELEATVAALKKQLLSQDKLLETRAWFKRRMLKAGGVFIEHTPNDGTREATVWLDEDTQTLLCAPSKLHEPTMKLAAQKVTVAEGGGSHAIDSASDARMFSLEGPGVSLVLEVPSTGNGLARANWVALFRWMPQQVSMVRPQTPPESLGQPRSGAESRDGSERSKLRSVRSSRRSHRSQQRAHTSARSGGNGGTSRRSTATHSRHSASPSDSGSDYTSSVEYSETVASTYRTKYKMRPIDSKHPASSSKPGRRTAEHAQQQPVALMGPLQGSELA